MLHAAAWMNFKTIMLSGEKSSRRILHYGITPFFKVQKQIQIVYYLGKNT